MFSRDPNPKKKIKRLFTIWTDEQLRVLIDNHKENNVIFYELAGNRKRIFWKKVSIKINLQFGTSYTDTHYKKKFESLKRDCKVCRHSSEISEASAMYNA
jgi:hypothetical protein